MGFNARAVREGRSFVHPGEDQLDPALSLRDDAGDPRSVGLPFDHEGTPKHPVDLVTAGAVVGLAHDRRTARAAGADSTGHAVAGGESFGAVPTNLVVEGRTTAGPDGLLAAVERGLLVSDFWYTRMLDPKTLVVTGLTRNGVFLVEDGAISAAVSNLRFTQSYAGALGPGRVLGVGDDAALIPVAYGSGGFVVPSLRLASWSFTGGAAG
jgi:predicted Zn-dependent protease